MADRTATGRAKRDLARRWYGTPAKLFEESELGLESTRDHLDAFERQVRRFHSKHFRRRGDGSAAEAFLENHYYDWVTYIVPRIAFQAPRVRVRSKVPAIFSEDARALQAATNQWIRDNRLEQLLQDIATDMQFNWGVAYVSQQPIPGAKPMEGIDPEDPDYIGIPHSPRVYRILQDLYFEDANARQKSDLRFKGHCFGRDLELLIEEAKQHPERGWDRAVLEKLQTMDSNERLGRDSRYASNRGEVVLREVWIPEAELDAYWDGTEAPDEGWRRAGFNGLVFTLADAPMDGWPRAPRPAYGPPSGAYQTFGCFNVPGSTKSLAPLIAVEEQVLELNAHTRAMAKSAADYKKMAFIENSDPKIAAMVRDGRHHGVYPVKGFKRENIMDVEVGGFTPEMLAYRDILLDRLNRNAHMDDPTRGKTTGATATESELASAATETRTEWIRNMHVSGTAGLLEKVLWFEYMDNRSSWPMGEQAADEMGIAPQRVSLSDGRVIEVRRSLTLRGGQGSNPNMPPFEALQLDCLPSSTRRQTEAEMQAQFAQASNFLLMTTPQIPVMPWVRWQQLYRAAGETFGMPEFESFVDFERALKEGPRMDMVLPGPALVNPRTGSSSPSGRPSQLPGAGMGRRGGGPRGLVQGASGGRSRGGGQRSAGTAGKASPRVGAALSAV